MPRNESTLDRLLCALVGALLLLALFVPGLPVLAIVALIAVGAILLATAALGFCPLYALFGLSTCPLERTGT